MTKAVQPRLPKQGTPRAVPFQGWLTSDEQEVERRRIRASAEPMTVRPLDASRELYGSFAVSSGSGDRPHRVDIRSLATLDNSCDCADFRKNGLGTCKHIEFTLARFRRKGRKAYEDAARQGSSRIEVYLSRRGAPDIRVMWPQRALPAAKEMLAPFFASDGVLLADPAQAIPSMKRALAKAPARVRTAVRVAQDVDEWVAELSRRQNRIRAREEFLRDVEAGKRTLDPVKARLYPYQQTGMLHLAFGERALLADEMGLGKTVQAIAACELLRQARHIERVLVVSPASLKAEWEEQIAKFTGLPSRIVWGSRAARLALYREPSFFYLCNYEQARSDLDEINEIIAPDVVILDEAQRIKNWQTQTAKTIKRLSSPYAFVLTGTPIENRIDEIYSIVEFLDPSVFGPLFRFNREFYELDDKGRPAGYKNLDELHRRLRPVMLRRRKDEVEDQLPERTVKNYFVAMAPEQRERYEEYSDRVARLVAISKRRPLLPEEFDKLQRWLACMRMICDTPFILDPECRVCPKLPELAEVIEDVMQSGDCKVLVFSEWERMLQLVRDLLRERKLDFAWHTGSVPQQRRRGEINRFKQDPGCRFFLSTDSGATGLNLQAANVVINLDLPWNPAKLEQRIARAWRKHQTRSVSVINIVCEDSIEHRMLGMLSQKQKLADGVLDGRGDLRDLKMPSGRAALVERLESLMGAPKETPPAPHLAPSGKPAGARGADAFEVFRQDMLSRLDTRLLLLESHSRKGGGPVMLAVVDGAVEQVRPLADRLLRESFAGGAETPALELLDRSTFDTIQRLAEAGVLKIDAAAAHVLHSHPAMSATVTAERERRRQAAQALFSDAQRKWRMSTVLKDGGFPIEAMPSLRDGVELALRACACLTGEPPDAFSGGVPVSLVESRLIAGNLVPADAAAVVGRLREAAKEGGDVNEETAASLLASGGRLIEQVNQALTKAALS